MNTIFSIFNLLVWGSVILILISKFIRSIRLVPTKYAYIVERFGKYHSTFYAGFHAMLPFIDKVEYIMDLKEETIDVPPQECFTFDNVKVEVDGVTYISVMDPVKASYGITNHREAAIQLAQTTTRSIIGTLELDKTFEERDSISNAVVRVLNEAGETWGIKVHRFEIKNISPPATVTGAMEKQVSAEREKRAVVSRSEGEMQSMINRSEGMKIELINRSEGEMQRRINEAEGWAQEILQLAKATATSIENLSQAITSEGGKEAVQLQLSEKWMDQFKKLAKEGTNVVLPMNLLSLDNMLRDIGLKTVANKEID